MYKGSWSRKLNQAQHNSIKVSTNENEILVLRNKFPLTSIHLTFKNLMDKIVRDCLWCFVVYNYKEIAYKKVKIRTHQHKLGETVIIVAHQHNW